ncbi:MAG: hypothetical protein V3S62_05730, partial [Acidimicrobiia bacterium]
MLVLVFALVAAACGDDDTADTTTVATVGEEGFTPGALGAVTVDAGAAVEIRALQVISGDLAFLGDDQVRGMILAIEDFGDINGHSVNLGTPEDE